MSLPEVVERLLAEFPAATVADLRTNDGEDCTIFIQSLGKGWSVCYHCDTDKWEVCTFDRFFEVPPEEFRQNVKLSTFDHYEAMVDFLLLHQT